MFRILILIVFFSSAAHAAQWKLVWSDEFDYERLPDSTRWNYEEGFVRNRELQYYTKARSRNAVVENGMLVMEAGKERFKNPLYDPAVKNDWRKEREYAEYTSASLTTQDRASWKYGRIEVRAKLPTGRGMWPAIWMLGSNIGEVGWPRCGEIDIMENVGYNPDTVYGTVHTEKYNHVLKTQKGSRIGVVQPHMDFHVYAVEWDSLKIDFFVDNTKYFTFRNDGTGEAAWPFDRDHYLILNIADGGAWGGSQGVDGDIFPQRMYVDYVRIYQKQ